MSQKNSLSKIIDKNINYDQSYPSSNQNQSQQKSKNPFYRSGRLRNRPNKLQFNNGLPVQEKIFGFARLLPRQYHQDKQLLYSENIKLKQRIRQLGQQNIRLKTRLYRQQKEKQQLLIEADKMANASEAKSYSKGGLKMTSDQHHSSKNSISLQSNYVAKKMFRDAKQEIEKLKGQNQRIKKSIKYTQIAELQAENENLLQQSSRLQSYIQQIIKQDNYDQYEQAITELKLKLNQERETIKNLPNQFRKKQEQMQQLKQKFMEVQKSKALSDKRLGKEISYLKSEIANLRKSNNELRVKQKDAKQLAAVIKITPNQDQLKWNQERKQFQKKINLLEKQLRQARQKQRSNNWHSKQPQNYRPNNWSELSQNKSRQHSVQQSGNNNKSLTKEEVKLDQVAAKKASPGKKSVKKFQTLENSPYKKSQLIDKSVQRKSQKRISMPEVVKKQKKSEPRIQQNVDTEKSNQQVQDSGDQDFQQKKKDSKPVAKNKQLQAKKERKPASRHNIAASQEKNEQEYQQSNDQQYDQQLNQEMPQKSKAINQQKASQEFANRTAGKQSTKGENSKKKKISQKQIKEQGYDEDSDNDDKQQFVQEDSKQEQVLSEKEAQKQQQKKNDSISFQPKVKSQEGSEIDKILKQTITYKFMAQRYSYEDFENDLKNSGVSTLSLLAITQMFSNEPFFLNDLQQQFIIVHCFGTTDIKETDVLPIRTFLNKMRIYIGEVNLIQEQEEQQLASQLSDAILGKQKSILNKLQKKQHQQGLINKKVFKTALQQLGLTTERQIDYALSEISVCSPDIENLNYVQFFSRFNNNNEQ